MKDLNKLKQAIQGELDRLAENCHDRILKELKTTIFKPQDIGWAKVLQDTIWAWFEERIEPMLDDLVANEVSNKEGELRKQ